MNNLSYFVFSNTSKSVTSYKLSSDDVKNLNDYLDADNTVLNFCLDFFVFRDDNILKNGTSLDSFEGFINKSKDGECEVFIVNCKHMLNKISSFRI